MRFSEQMQSSFSKVRSAGSQWFDAAWISLVGVLGALVYFQGWRSNPMSSADMLPYYQAAWQLVTRGQLMDHGNATSFQSFNPPGLVFFFAPGALFIPDPRLWELPGILILLVLELLFLYLIVRRVFGRPLALVGVAAVGISLLGNPGYWTSGHPAFILAALYFLLRWAGNRSPLALSVALVILALGLYTYMGMLPFCLAIPIIWIVYRPPVSIRHLVLCSIVSVLIWLPFLRFEVTRDFVDFRSMILRETPSALEGGQASPLPRCYTSVAGLSDTLEGTYIDRGVPEGEATPIIYSGSSLAASIRYKLCVAFVNLDRNFDTDYFSLGVNQSVNSALWLLFLSGMVTMLAVGMTRWRLFSRWLSRLWEVKWWYVAAAALLGGGLLWGLLNPLLLGAVRTILHMDRQWLGLFKQLRSFAPLIWAGLLWGMYAGKSWASDRREEIGIVGLGLAVPWLALMVLAEPDRAMRFWWLWPLEMLAVLIAVEGLGRVVFPHGAKGSVLLVGAVVLLILPISYWQPKLRSWSQVGFAGESTGRLEAADFVGDQARLRDTTTLFVGYDLADPDWSTQYQETHLAYFLKGAWIDFLLLSRHGVINLDQSSQRLSDRDDFRIFEHPAEVAGTSTPAPEWPGYMIVARFGSYEVYIRVGNQSPG